MLINGKEYKEPQTGLWSFYAIWQFSSTGKVDGIDGRVDLNTTTMNLETLKKYGKPKTAFDTKDVVIAGLKIQLEELAKTNAFLKATAEKQAVKISELQKSVKEQKAYCDQIFSEKEKLRSEYEGLILCDQETETASITTEAIKKIIRIFKK